MLIRWVIQQMDLWNKGDIPQMAMEQKVFLLPVESLFIGRVYSSISQVLGENKKLHQICLLGYPLIMDHGK